MEQGKKASWRTHYGFKNLTSLEGNEVLGCFKQPNINKASEDCQPPRILVWGRAERNVAGNKGRAGVLWDIRGAKALDTGGLVHGLVITVT